MLRGNAGGFGEAFGTGRFFGGHGPFRWRTVSVRERGRAPDFAAERGKFRRLPEKGLLFSGK